MKLTIVTPQKLILEGISVEEINVPGETGQLGILPHHAPLVSTLGSGELKYRLPSDKQFQVLPIQWGWCEIRFNEVIILAESVLESP